MKTFLTKNGILASNVNEPAFFTNSGEFVRHSSWNEYEYLTQEIGLTEIEICNPKNELELFLVHNQICPKWKFLFSTEDIDDTNFEEGKSCNGGAYSNTDHHSYFVRINSGRVEFACLTESFSSAEFHQTWNGSYQNANDCNYTTLIDVEGDWRLSEWQREESEASLLQGYGQKCGFADLFHPTTYTPSRYEDDTTPQETPIGYAEYLRRWRLICAAAGQTAYQIAERKRGKKHGAKNGRRR